MLTLRQRQAINKALAIRDAKRAARAPMRVRVARVAAFALALFAMR